MNEKYIVLGIILIIVGVPFFLSADEIVSEIIPYPKQRIVTITDIIEEASKHLDDPEGFTDYLVGEKNPYQKSVAEYESAVNSYYAKIQAVKFSGIIIALIGLILTIVGITVPPTKDQEEKTSEIETPKEKENKLDTITEIIETYKTKGYKVMKYEFEDPILKVSISKDNKTYLATFNMETKKAKYDLIEEETQKE